MGVYDRDYYRHDPPGGGLLGGVAPACRAIIAINVAVYVLQLLTVGTRGGITLWLMLDPDRVFGHFEIWRLLTYAFCHDLGGIWHIVGNMFFLWICGRHVEPIYGTREFVKFYLTAAVLSGLCFLGFGLLFDDPTASLGASGAVMAVTVVCAMYYPTMEILLLFIIPVQLRWLVLIYVIFDLHPVLLQIGGTETMTGVAHTAHLGGLLYGFLYKRYDLRFSRLLGEWKLPRVGRVARMAAARRRSKLRLYEPPDDAGRQANLERQVDEILAKISTHGEASLSESEREVLKEASRRYKKR